jgi:hypothetical protein
MADFHTLPRPSTPLPASDPGGAAGVTFSVRPNAAIRQGIFPAAAAKHQWSTRQSRRCPRGKEKVNLQGRSQLHILFAVALVIYMPQKEQYTDTQRDGSMRCNLHRVISVNKEAQRPRCACSDAPGLASFGCRKCVGAV